MWTYFSFIWLCFGISVVLVSGCDIRHPELCFSFLSVEETLDRKTFFGS